ncbi:Pickpocket protein 28 [Frankliniella fusca]|uniref:Pickpocket protein 28 n=1 Tax=Frankliniella fusca TaxID=407009 RepID=A0AAE1I3F9_9NEOP|nr:Pickpocket protein 28 [Frankliniella fusca]
MRNIHSIASLTKQTSGDKMDCFCTANCNEVSYVVDSDTSQPWFLGTDLKWSLTKHPRMRFRRDLIFGMTDLLVHVGSTAGLFLGCSVLSVIELLYFLTLRLYWYTRTPPPAFSPLGSTSATAP